MRTDWTVDYGQGPRPVTLPHAWRQDVPVGWEGPAIYRCQIDVQPEPGFLLFHGVSYAADVFLDGAKIGEHKGIWDAFTVPLPAGPRTASLEVRVVKNGGPSYPVRDVASGFLPYVFNTFGGIHGAVEHVAVEPDPLSAPPSRVRVEGNKVFVEGKPFYARGVLTWGWYPELGHTNPDDDTIRREIAQAKALGFNLIKFCLWVPSHRYLDIMREEGLEAWLELPIWDPSPEPAHLEGISREIERIVEQYRRHDNIILWTVGCELSTATPAAYRRELVEMVKRETGCPLVKDNSGGAEMYGGDLREFGDFYDFHPYCDTEFYPPVLDSLLPGPRTAMPVFLGEYNDIDAHRDVARLLKEQPYWVLPNDELNPQGVRWQFDIPGFLPKTRFAKPENRQAHERLMRDSHAKAIFIRKFVHEAVRARDAIAGYVVTGWRDTPISTAGVIDDWNSPRFLPNETRAWNSEDVLFLIPTRRPPWIDGGNRPGYLDSFNFFEGAVFWKVGIHSENGVEGMLEWRVVDEAGTVMVAGKGEALGVPALESRQVAELYWPEAKPGIYDLSVRFGSTINQWPIWIVPNPDWTSLGGWTMHDPARLFGGLKLPEGEGLVATRLPNDLEGIVAEGRRTAIFLADEGTRPAPFWRESAYEFLNDDFWTRLGFRNRWERLLAVSGDRTIDLDALPKGVDVEVLMNRIDVRTYEEAPVMVRLGKSAIVTTLRPFGGFGVQPIGIGRNPAGAALLRGLLAEL